jgi:serine/threonine protein kinase
MSKKRPGDERGTPGEPDDALSQLTVITPKPVLPDTDRLPQVSPSGTIEYKPKPSLPPSERARSRSKIPTQIGRYQVLECVGRGGMGVLYRGIDPTLDREVAIKLMLADFSEDAELLRPRFYREARAVAKLQHRNIVTIFEFAEDGQTPYIVMEFLRGTSLAARLDSAQPLTLDETLDIVIQLCAGLSYAHEQGVVHRDVKPANIFLLTDGAVKLLDFGIAKVMSSNLTRRGDVLGSLAYVSPEQVVGSESLDGRADLFSTGVVLYELLSKRKPFEGVAPTAIVMKILSEDPTPIETLVPGIPERLAAIVRRALEKEPAKRFATAADFSRELQLVRRELDARDNPPIVTTDTGSVRAIDPPAASEPAASTGDAFDRKWIVPAGIAAGVVIVAVAITIMMSRSGTRSTDLPPGGTAVATAPADPPAATVSVPSTIVVTTPATTTTRPSRGDAAGATLQVTSDPPGATITLDGRDTRQVTPAEVAVRGAGPHRLRLSKRGFQSLDLRLTAADVGKGAVGYTLTASEAEPPAAGLVAVTIKGSYAFEIVDGSRVISASSTSHQVNVAAGSKLRLVAPDFSLNQTVTIDATPDRRAEFHAPALGRLTIRSAAETCRVRIGDRDLGYPPINNIAIAAGSYRIDLLCPNGTNKTGFATVSPGQAVRAIVQ